MLDNLRQLSQTILDNYSRQSWTTILDNLTQISQTFLENNFRQSQTTILKNLIMKQKQSMVVLVDYKDNYDYSNNDSKQINGF